MKLKKLTTTGIAKVPITITGIQDPRDDVKLDACALSASVNPEGTAIPPVGIFQYLERNKKSDKKFRF